MCGLSALYSFHEPISRERMQKLLSRLQHRGPDGEGIWISSSQKQALGHRRLSILDLTSAGDQPMQFGRYQLVFNGEIFNYVELRQELSAKGRTFHTRSDSEVLLQAYDEWKEDCFSRLNGMWAFVIVDTETGEMTVSRDRYGEKPLYYHFDPEKRLAVASEVQALHHFLGAQQILDETVIASLVQGLWTHHGTDRTHLRGVRSLPAGHWMRVSPKGIEVRKWYQLPQVQVPEKYTDQVQKLRELLTDSVRIRLRSDVPIATCLSGGVDSGGVAALVRNLLPQETFFGFTAAFPGTPIDESESAKKTAEALKIPLRILQIQPPTPDALEGAMQRADGPLNNMAFYPIDHLYGFIRENGIKVTLDGQGPDEMLGGYAPIFSALKSARLARQPLRYLDVYRTYAAQGEWGQFSARKNAWDAVKKDWPKWFSREALATHQDPLEVELKEQFFEAPLPGILMNYDRCSMAHGVECRMPYMDYRVVEFVHSLPLDSRVGHGFTKRILRDALRGLVLDETLNNRRKIGFNSPLVDWFRGPLKSWMLDVMLMPEFQQSPYFDGRKLSAEFEVFVNEPNPQWATAWRFWPPVHLAWWLRYVRTQMQ